MFIECRPLDGFDVMSAGLMPTNLRNNWGPSVLDRPEGLPQPGAVQVLRTHGNLGQTHSSPICPIDRLVNVST